MLGENSPSSHFLSSQQAAASLPFCSPFWALSPVLTPSPLYFSSPLCLPSLFSFSHLFLLFPSSLLSDFPFSTWGLGSCAHSAFIVSHSSSATWSTFCRLLRICADPLKMEKHRREHQLVILMMPLMKHQTLWGMVWGKISWPVWNHIMSTGYWRNTDLYIALSEKGAREGQSELSPLTWALWTQSTTVA